MNKEQLAESREVDYRLSKWIITNIEQLLSPEEIEERRLKKSGGSCSLFICRQRQAWRMCATQ